MTLALNPTGLRGLDFIEFASPEPERLHHLFLALGFSHTRRHRAKAVDLYEQNDIAFLINREPGTFAASFQASHGPSVSAMGWRFDQPSDAQGIAVSRGAKAAGGDYAGAAGRPVPAIQGIGESRLYFVGASASPGRWSELGFDALAKPERVPDRGFLTIDHLTHNVHAGTMGTWSRFYQDVFGFTEVRHFEIRGVKTGLTSHALRSADGSFCIPLNEAGEKKSQINEYLDEYRGPGIQHIAFLTNDILASLDALEGGPVGFLDIEPSYYQHIFERVPRVTQDHERIAQRQVLVDGDDQGYLLQIFTKNLIGPVFFELIFRHNHASFGEGNFGALFRSIERDQMRRGYL